MAPLRVFVTAVVTSSKGNVPRGGGNGGTTDRRGRRVAIPEGFLRVPGWSGGLEVSSDPQVAADARLAMMLQVYLGGE